MLRTSRPTGQSSAARSSSGRIPTVNLTSLARRAGRTRWFAALGRSTSRLDRRLQVATRGRWSVLGRPRLPQVVLTTTGRRSGEPREVVLVAPRHGTGWVVIASNWGQAHHPAWALNLLADPRAVVTERGTGTPVRARVVADEEARGLVARLRELWPGYEAYAERAGRELYVFALEPQDPDESDGSDEAPPRAPRD